VVGKIRTGDDILNSVENERSSRGEEYFGTASPSPRVSAHRDQTP
jgi:hypothetical protein